MTVSVYIATSLDGYIAREDGAIDWLMEHSSEDSGEDYGYRAFMDTVDVLVMGRNSFEKVLTFGTWPYGDTRVVVLSSRLVNIPDNLPDTVQSMSGSPSNVVARLADQGAKHLYVDGGLTIQRFLEAGLVSRLIITTIPVLIGSGIPLFGPLSSDVPLKHIDTTAFKNGLVQTTYEVVKP